MLPRRSPILYVIYLPLALLFVMLLITGGLVIKRKIQLPVLQPVSSTPDDTFPEYLPGEGTISGKLFLEDGSPNPYPFHIVGLIQSRSPGSPSPATLVFSHSNNVKDNHETFCITEQAGEMHLLILAQNLNDFATTHVGPIANIAGGNLEDLRVVLQKGLPLEIFVENFQGERIPSATVKFCAYLSLRGSDSGSWSQAIDLGGGRFQLLQSEGVKLKLQVAAKGFQEQTVHIITTPVQHSKTVTLIPALPTTGKVVDRTGIPLSGVKLFDKYEVGPPRFYSSDKLLAITDQEGQFLLDSLRLDSSYYGYLEAPNQRRVLFENLQADQRDLKFEIPERTLRGFLHGDLKSLRSFQTLDRSQIKIHQTLKFKTGTFTYFSTPLRDDIIISPTEEGGEFIYNGLVGGKVELEIGPHRVPFDYSAEPNWCLDFDLASGKATFTPASKDPRFDTPAPPASAQDWRGRLLQNRFLRNETASPQEHEQAASDYSSTKASAN